MSTLLRLSFFSFVVIVFCCAGLAESRHIHHHHQARHLNRKHVHHRHHERQVASPIFATLPAATTSAVLPSMTAGDDMAEDVEQIQTGMNNFTADLSSFFEAIQQWLDALRSMFEGNLSPQTAPSPGIGPVGPEIPTSIPTVTPSVTHHEPLPLLTVAPEPTTLSTSSMCRSAAGAGPLVPCPESHSTSFQTITSTSTRSNTITTYQTVSYGNISISANGTGMPMLPTAAPYPSLNISFSPATPVTLSVQYISTTTPAVNANGSLYTSTLMSYAVSPTPSPYTFNATSQDNVAVYYGTSPSTTIGGLLTLCANPNVDIVILSFVSDFLSAGGYPSADFGPGCIESNNAAAPGLKDCSPLAPEIAGCQQVGKKVLVSLGGYVANSAFASSEEATAFASTLWNLFGAGDGRDPSLRPFGPSQAITVDGFDIDNEDHSTAYYDTFVSALRTHFAEDPGKTYYISAAPQCPIPDASISTAVMAQADFVWVQFYNNPSCNLDTEAFQSSFAAWSANLAALSSTGGPRLFVGIPSFPAAGPGYVEGAALYSRITQARELDVPNLGGIMLWEGTEALGNVDGYGVDYLAYAKDALHL